MSFNIGRVDEVEGKTRSVKDPCHGEKQGDELSLAGWQAKPNSHITGRVNDFSAVEIETNYDAITTLR